MPMQVVTGGNMNALNMPVMGDGFRDWSFGLFDCFADLSTCMYDTQSTTYRHLQYRFTTNR